MSLSIRPARPGDAPLVFGFVRELAAYERLAHEVDADEATIDAALFGENPRVFCDIAEWEGEPVGFALWFYNFSTFRGRHGIYLEDLYVRDSARGAAASARRSSPPSPRAAATRGWRGSNGGCSTGTPPPSRSTSRWERCRWTSGP